jgi:signal transduction histidine kinase
MLKQYVWELNSNRIREIAHVLFSSGDMCGLSVMDDYGNLLFKSTDCRSRLNGFQKALLWAGLVEIDDTSIVVTYDEMNIGSITFYTVDFRRTVAISIFMIYFLVYLLLSRYLENLRMRQKLEAVNKELSETLSTLKHTIKELETTRTELVRQEKFQSLVKLMAQIAHDVNTPLGVAYTSVSELSREIQRISQLYKDKLLEESEFREFLEIGNELIDLLERNIQRAYELIRSFKKITSYEVSEEKMEFEVMELIRDIVKSFGKRFEKAGVKVNISGDNKKISSYPGAIVRILTNLLENSLVHGFNGRSGGEIDIHVSIANGQLTIDYRDNGKGLSPSIVDKVFEPFFTTKSGGYTTGLGLSIIYNLVTSTLNGTVKIDENYKHGFRIVISFPVEEVE